MSDRHAAIEESSAWFVLKNCEADAVAGAGRRIQDCPVVQKLAAAPMMGALNLRLIGVLTLAGLTSACLVGPDYARPSAETPLAFYRSTTDRSCTRTSDVCCVVYCMSNRSQRRRCCAPLLRCRML